MGYGVMEIYHTHTQTNTYIYTHTCSIRRHSSESILSRLKKNNKKKIKCISFLFKSVLSNNHIINNVIPHNEIPSVFRHASAIINEMLNRKCHVSNFKCVWNISKCDVYAYQFSRWYLYRQALNRKSPNSTAVEIIDITTFRWVYQNVCENELES